MTLRWKNMPKSVVRGRTNYPLHLTALSFGFMAALGTTAALAQCAAPATQLTSGVTETGTVTFQALGNGSTLSNITVAGLTLTCGNNSGVTASAQALFYQNLANGAAGPSAPAGCASGKSGNLTGWTSGPASGNSVTFTSTTPNTNVADLVVSNGAGASAVEVQGSATGGALSTALTGNMVCVGSAGNWRNQEYHASGGAVTDFKKGSSDPKDPSAVIGTWSISNDAVVYNYTAGGSYSYTIWQPVAGTLNFCNGGSLVVQGTVKTGGPQGC